MLVLTRRPGEVLLIGDDAFRVARVEGDRAFLCFELKVGGALALGPGVSLRLAAVRTGLRAVLAVEAPPAVRIDRLEVRERREADAAKDHSPAEGASQ